MTDFQDILYFYPEKKKKNKSSLQETYFFNQRVSFLSLKRKHSLHTKMTSFVCFLFFIRPSKTGRIMGSPVAGGLAASSSLSGAYLQNYSS